MKVLILITIFAMSFATTYRRYRTVQLPYYPQYDVSGSSGSDDDHSNPDSSGPDSPEDDFHPDSSGPDSPEDHFHPDSSGSDSDEDHFHHNFHPSHSSHSPDDINKPSGGPNPPLITEPPPMSTTTSAPTSTTSAPTSTTTSASNSTTKRPTTEECIKKCSFPCEFTPVCGTDGATYINIEFLQCNMKCGVAVKMLMPGMCSSTLRLTAPPPTWTSTTSTTSIATPTSTPTPTPAENSTMPTLPVTPPTESSLQECVDKCMMSQIYDPACGTDGLLYMNLDALVCTRLCGKNVGVMMLSACFSGSINDNSSGNDSNQSPILDERYG